MGRKEKGESVRVMGGTEEKGEAGEGRVGGGGKKWEEKVGKKETCVYNRVVPSSVNCHRQ